MLFRGIFYISYICFYNYELSKRHRLFERLAFVFYLRFYLIVCFKYVNVCFVLS